MRFEDAGIEEMYDEAATPLPGGIVKEETSGLPPSEQPGEATIGAVIRTLDGEEPDDDDDIFARNALQYELLMGKIDVLLDKLQLDA